MYNAHLETTNTTIYSSSNWKTSATSVYFSGSVHGGLQALGTTVTYRVIDGAKEESTASSLFTKTGQATSIKATVDGGLHSFYR